MTVRKMSDPRERSILERFAKRTPEVESMRKPGRFSMKEYLITAFSPLSRSVELMERISCSSFPEESKKRRNKLISINAFSYLKSIITLYLHLPDKLV